MYPPEQTTLADLRSFASVWTLLLLAVLLWKAELAASDFWVLIIAFLLLLVGVVVPRMLYAPYRVWMYIGSALSWVMLRVFLTLIFFVLVTPLGLIRRAMRNFHGTREYPTYWLNRDQRE